MKRSLFLFIFFSILALSGRSQSLTNTIRGSVIDKESKQPLPGASIIVVGSEPLLGATTDMDGRFRIPDVPVGRSTIRITYLGYHETFLSDIIVNSAKEVVVNVEMEEHVVAAKEVTITAKTSRALTNNELVLVSGRSFTVDQTQRYAAGYGDPSRMASNFAGVSGSGNDQRNDIIIRGNSPLGLLWRLEGADVPNPNHFGSQGANGGPISILNNNLLSNSDFLTGAFPAEYGNANAGVFDIKLRNGNNEKREFILQIGFGGLELDAEGPMSKKAGSSYLLSYRYSTLSFFDAVGIKFGRAGIPQYQDAAFKFNFPKTPLGSFTLWGIGGKSSTQLLDSKKTGSDRSALIFPEDVDYSSKMGATGLTHLLQLNKSTYIRTVLSASGEGNNTRVDSLNDWNDRFLILNSNTQSGRYAIHSFINKKINARHAVKIGLIESRLSATMSDSLWLSEINHYYRRLDFSGTSYLTQLYINWNYHITEKITWNSGMHFNYFHLNRSYSIEPRAGIRWQFKPRQSLSFGFGIHGQIQPLYIYYYKTLTDTLKNIYTETNKNLGMSKARHYVIGYDYLLSDHVRFKAEAYYQDLYDLPVTQNPGYFSTVNFGAEFVPAYADSLVNNGVGRNYGIEITVERFFSWGYYYLLTGSFYESDYKGSDNIWRNTAFNGNFVMNMLGGKEWKVGRNRNSILALSLKITYAGGRRYVPVNVAQSIAKGDVVYDEAHAYEKRLKDYFRTDIKISYRWNTKRFTQEFSLDIQNIFDTQNILAYQWSPKTNSIQTSYQIGFFPVPFYRLYF